MTKIEVTEYTPDQWSAVAHIWEGIADPRQKLSGPTWVFRARGEAIAMAGAASPWDGVAEAWVQARPGAYHQFPRLVLAVRTLCRQVAGDYLRFQATTSRENAYFAYWCGFQPEALLTEYLPGAVDAWVMRWR